MGNYAICKRQVAALLGYGKPQVLEVFKNTIPSRLHWDLLPIEDLRQAVETAKRILTKERIDGQLADQPMSTPSTNINDSTGYNQKAVPLDNQNVLDTKSAKLTAVMI